MRRLTVIIAILVLLGAVAARFVPFSQKHTSPPTTPDDRVGESKNIPTSIPGLSVPEGFAITYYAQGVDGARSLSKNKDDSIIYVGTRGSNLYAILDQDHDGISEKTVVIRSDLDTPNGVAYSGGDLYVAEVSRILRFADIDNTYASTPSYEVIYDELPKDTHHGWKYIAFDPSGLLYIPIGAPCNVCNDQGIYSRLLTLNIETKELKTFATGIRNTVGFDFSPLDNTLYFTDNGRDLLGDNTPPDELNHAPTPGLDFGFPSCHGKDVVDPKFGDADSCTNQVAPLVELGPHVAALGTKFYRGNLFPSTYQNKLIIAEHGSWNRRDPIGYRLTIVDPIEKTYQEFVTGWLTGDESWGRPVDLLELKDGSMLISDDLNDSLYRLSYTPTSE